MGQAIAAVTLLSATIKFKGSLILQAQGDGAVKALVAQCTHDQTIRGWAKCEAEKLSGDTLWDRFGVGHLALTIKSEDAEPYQGIVPLSGDNLSVALENYFCQSEQLKTRIWLFANSTRASGLLLQELPDQRYDPEDWNRLVLLADTVSENELMNLSCETLLQRLFNEEKVRLFDAQTVCFKCHCSHEKIAAALISMGAQSLKEILQEKDDISVDCEFCGRKYHFDGFDIARLFNDQQGHSAAPAKH